MVSCWLKEVLLGIFQIRTSHLFHIKCPVFFCEGCDSCWYRGENERWLSLWRSFFQHSSMLINTAVWRLLVILFQSFNTRSRRGASNKQSNNQRKPAKTPLHPAEVGAIRGQIAPRGLTLASQGRVHLPNTVWWIVLLLNKCCLITVCFAQGLQHKNCVLCKILWAETFV